MGSTRYPRPKNGADWQVDPYRGWTLCLTPPFMGLRYLVDPIAWQQPHISIYKVKRSAVHKLITLDSKVLLDDGNRILNPGDLLIFALVGNWKKIDN